MSAVVGAALGAVLGFGAAYLMYRIQAHDAEKKAEQERTERASLACRLCIDLLLRQDEKIAELHAKGPEELVIGFVPGLEPWEMIRSEIVATITDTRLLYRLAWHFESMRRLAYSLERHLLWSYGSVEQQTDASQFDNAAMDLAYLVRRDIPALAPLVWSHVLGSDYGELTDKALGERLVAISASVADYKPRGNLR